jgi:hypothetical protein
MDNSRCKRERAELIYPPHAFSPEDLLTFVEMDGFLDEWMSHGLNDDDLGRFQAMIMAGPKHNPIVADTEGFRILKMRRDPQSEKQVRLGYVYFEEYGVVLLVATQVDDEMERMSQEARIKIGQLIRREHAALSNKVFR